MKDKLILKVAEQCDLSQDIVHRIISFQGEDALKHIKIVHELEFSGFGKFLLSQHKVKRKIKKLEDIIYYLNLKDPRDQTKIDSVEKELESFKNKLK